MAGFEAERTILGYQLQARLKEIEETIYSARQPIGGIEACVTGPGKGPERAPKSGWKPFKVHDRWGGFDQTTWFRMKVRVPASMKGHRVVALVRPCGESLAYIDGKPVQGLDRNRDELYLTEKARGGETFEIVLESVPSVRFDEYHYFEHADLVVMHPTAWDFWWDCSVIMDVLEVLPTTDTAYPRLQDLLNRAMKSVDLQHKNEPAYWTSLQKARQLLQAGLKDFEAPPGAGRLTVTGQSHIDTAWLWPLRETRRKCGRTFSTALTLLDRYPEFVFMASQPVQFEWMKKEYPEQFRRVKRHVKSGQWEPLGAMWVECDCNVPSGEAFVRQLLFGNRFWRKEFGVHSRTAWLPDTFGDSWSLPQILKKAQVDTFVTTKLTWSQFNRPAHSVWQWEGTDGTRILAMHPYHNYNGLMRIQQAVEQWDNFKQKDLIDECPYPAGHGDGGGGPTMKIIERGKRLGNIVGVPQCSFGRMQDSIDRMAAQCDFGALPRWNDELYLELHRGCQTTQARTKRNNRKCELLLRDAEFFNSLALLDGGKYDQKNLEEAWKIVLTNQFHDILPGSSITEVYAQADIDYAEAKEMANTAMRAALERLSGRIDAGGEGVSIVVFNTLSWERCDVVRAQASLPKGAFHVLDAQGNPVPCQRIGRDELVFLANDLPPLGYAVYRILPGTVEASPEGGLKAKASGMENDYVRVRFDKKGRLSSVYDKVNRREVLPKGEAANVLQLFDDRPGRNDAWDIDHNFDEIMWEPAAPESVDVVEEGPVRAVVRMVRKTERSTITQDIVLHAHSPRIDFVTNVDWHEKRVLMKVAFPVDVRASQATYEIQFGSIERPTHHNTTYDRARFEVTGHKWADLSEGDYGASLLNDCKYGYDVKDNVLRLSLLRSPVMPDEAADEGLQEFTYSLFPHTGDWRHGAVQQGYELNCPVVAVQGGNGQGRLASTASFASVDTDHVVIDTVKRHEDSSALIVRLYEALGQRGARHTDLRPHSQEDQRMRPHGRE